MRTIFFLLLLGFGWLLALPAFAAGPTLLAGAGILREPMPGTMVYMPYLIAPIVVDDKLIAYAYVSSEIIAASPSAAIDIRDKTPFIQDSYVRDVNATVIGKADDPSTVDAPALAARMLADAKKVMGAGKALGVKIVQIQMRVFEPEN